MENRLTPQQAANEMGITVYLFRKLAQEGKLPFVLVTGDLRKTYVVSKEKFEQWRKQ